MSDKMSKMIEMLDWLFDYGYDGEDDEYWLDKDGADNKEVLE